MFKTKFMYDDTTIDNQKASVLNKRSIILWLGYRCICSAFDSCMSLGNRQGKTSYKYSQDDIINWELSSLVYLLSFIIFHISFKVKKPRKDPPPPTLCDEDCIVFFPELLLKRRFSIENEKHFFSVNEIAQKWPAMEVLICSCRQ